MRRFAKWFFAALSLALLVRTLWQTDLARALTLIRGLGPLAPALAIPALFVLAFESLAWRVSLRALGRPSPWRLAKVRLATDAVLMSIPGGVVIAEVLSPGLLRTNCGLTLPEAAAASVARKWLGTKAHALYIFLATALGWHFLASRGATLPWLVLAAGFLPLVIAFGTEHPGIGRLVEKLIPRANAEVAKLLQQDRRTVHLSTLLYLAAWLCESIEAFVITRALGAHFSFTEILAVEAGLSIIRSLAFFAPSGIGVQDLGYVALFGPIGAAFVLLKRARELVWIGVGWLFLAANRLPVRTAA